MAYPPRPMKKLSLPLAALLLASCILMAASPTWGTDLGKALSEAKQTGKMSFLLLGREDCGICQATKALVNGGRVPVTPDRFVIAEIDTTDLDADAAFLAKFGRDNFGDTLPFVVITDSEGKMLAHYSGPKSAGELTEFVNVASAKAAAERER